LKIIISALRGIYKEDDTQLVCIGAREEKDDFFGMPIKFIEWSEEIEVKQIQNFDVGITPVLDEPWERGKCVFKLIQYMACGLPVVGSPVGANIKIIKHGINGYQAKNIDEWIWALRRLKDDHKLRKKTGKAGREIVEKEHCLQVTAPRLRDLIFSVVKGEREKE